MEADMVNLGKEIDRLERQAAYDMELNKATSTAVTNAPAPTEAAKTGRASSEYKEDLQLYAALLATQPKPGDILPRDG
jgi:hypothetical protein